MRRIFIGLLALFALTGLSGAAFAVDDFQHKFRTFLSGAQEVGEVATATRGQFRIKFSRFLDHALFKLGVRNGFDVTQAHIHCGPAGVNGPVVVFLFGPDPGTDVDGFLTGGVLTNADIIPPDPAGPCGTTVNNIASLLAALFDGRLYINVHTTANPGGEVRGQLFPGHD